MSDTAPLSEFDVVTRHMVMERDINPAGHLFGGAMLAWLDEATAVYVMERIGFSDFVTVALEDVRFQAPGHRGDIITIYSRIVATGRSSITAETCAINHELQTGKDREIITCRFTFVCLKDHEPYPYFQSEAYAQWVRQHQRGAAAP
jgi:acyl-CoA thioesterase YciA